MKENGFALVEMVVVIWIAGILLSPATLQFKRMRPQVPAGESHVLVEIIFAGIL